MTFEERIQAIETEQSAHRERLDRMEDLMARVIEANNNNAIAIGHLSEKIDRFVDAVFARGGNGSPDKP